MDIYELLKINSDVIQGYGLLADQVVTRNINKVLEDNLDKLNQIIIELGGGGGINVSKKSIDEIINKVIKQSEAKAYSNDNWNVRELRILSYNMMKLWNNGDAYNYALLILDKKWHNIFFNGLVFYLLDSWNRIKPDFRQTTCTLLRNKLLEYKDTNKKYMLYRNHSNFFDEAGPMRVARLLITQKMNLTDAPSLIGHKNATIRQSYYSDVIIRYFKEQSFYRLDEISQIFSMHHWDRTKKLVLAHLVELEDQRGDEFKRDQLCKYINKNIGDVTLYATWSFDGATEEEEETLKRAKDLVVRWYAQRFIETFFEVCVQDRYRKKFWLDYITYISNVKIVGSKTIKTSLENNDKTNGLLSGHFIETHSQKSQTAALVMFTKNKMLVEFSDTGALYVYNQDHLQVKKVTQRPKSITSVADLKTPSTNMLIDIFNDYYNGYGYKKYNYNEEGRMFHSGNWQIRLRGWFDKMVLSR